MVEATKNPKASSGIDDRLDKWLEESSLVLDGGPQSDEFVIEDDLMVGEIDSTKVDHDSLIFTLNQIQNCINHIQQNVNNIKVAAKQSKRHTFGNNANSAELLTDKDRDQIDQIVNIGRTREKITLDHALVLVKHMFHLKLENMQLKNHNKEMQAILK